MKRKLFFASVAIATVMASCTKEEIVIVDNQLQELGNRPMVEAPVATIGNAGTKMTTSGAFAGVKWEAGDGFGAAVMDTYNPAGTTFANTFTIVDYINSNVLFSTQDGVSFTAEASMPEGNHLFYAPFNKANISRKALATQLPLEQVVANPSSNAAAPSNDIITAFYEDGTSPVFVAYDKIYGEAKTSLDLQMRHIYSLPLVTLKLGEEVQIYKNGVLNVTEDADGEEVPVYESKIVVDSIVFANTIASKGAISNEKIAAKLGKDEDGNIVWDAVKYETAATADLLKAGTTEEKVVVKFEGGQELTANKNGYFFMVLPGAEYAKANLGVYVYATINGVHYVSAASLSEAQAIAPAKDVRLLPGLPYSADEYNADGTMKDSKGTSMTYVVDGKFSPVAKAEVSGYNAISNYAELANFITKVAYRGEELVEITKEQAIQMLKDEEYDAKKYFVITAEKEAPVVLDDAFVTTFNNSCVITNKNASIKFLGNSENLVLGNITWDEEVDGLFTFANEVVYAKGNVVMEAAIAKVITLAGAEVTLESEDAVVVENNVAATVNINSEAAHTVKSTAGTVNILVSTEANVENGLAGNKKNTALASKSTLNIVDGVIATGTIKNLAHETVAANGTKTMHYAEVNVDAAVATIENNGKVNVNSNKAKLTVTGTGSVDNTIGAVVKNTGNTVYATVSTFEDFNETYDNLCGLNKLVLTGAVEYDEDLDLAGITTIDFNTGSSLSMGSVMNGGVVAAWDLTGKTININDNITWTGRDASVSKIKVDAGAIKVANKKKLTIIDINVYGYNAVVSDATELATALAAGGNVTLKADVNGGDIVLTKATTLDLNGKKLTGNITSSANLVVKNGEIVNTNPDKSGVEVTGTATLTLDNVNIESKRHAVRVESTGAVIINGGEYKGNGTHASQYALNIGSSTVAANVTINGGKFVGPVEGATNNASAVCVQGASKLAINGGEFSGSKSTGVIYVPSTTATIACKGGKFVNFNPACPTNFVAENYKVTVTRTHSNGTTEDATALTPSTTGETDKTFAEQAYNDAWSATYAYTVVAK